MEDYKNKHFVPDQRGKGDQRTFQYDFISRVFVLIPQHEDSPSSLPGLEN